VGDDGIAGMADVGGHRHLDERIRLAAVPPGQNPTVSRPPPGLPGAASITPPRPPVTTTPAATARLPADGHGQVIDFGRRLAGPTTAK